MTREEWEKHLNELADCLDRAPRKGAGEDSPEGSKYILLSDTSAKMISAELRSLANMLDEI